MQLFLLLHSISFESFKMMTEMSSVSILFSARCKEKILLVANERLVPALRLFALDTRGANGDYS